MRHLGLIPRCRGIGRTAVAETELDAGDVNDVSVGKCPLNDPLAVDKGAVRARQVADDPPIVHLDDGRMLFGDRVGVDRVIGGLGAAEDERALQGGDAFGRAALLGMTFENRPWRWLQKTSITEAKRPAALLMIVRSQEPFSVSVLGGTKNRERLLDYCVENVAVRVSVIVFPATSLIAVDVTAMVYWVPAASGAVGVRMTVRISAEKVIVVGTTAWVLVRRRTTSP